MTYALDVRARQPQCVSLCASLNHVYVHAVVYVHLQIAIVVVVGVEYAGWCLSRFAHRGLLIAPPADDPAASKIPCALAQPLLPCLYCDGVQLGGYKPHKAVALTHHGRGVWAVECEVRAQLSVAGRDTCCAVLQTPFAAATTQLEHLHRSHRGCGCDLG